MGTLDGKKVFVTGGSRGIGAGIVKALAEAGAQIAFSYTSRPDAAEEVLSQLPGDGHFIVKMNVSDESETESAFNQVMEKFGQIDGIVNNAGITRDGLMLRMKTDDFDQVVQTNLRGAWLCCKLATKPMMKAKSGSIVNITSVVGQSGNPGQTNYTASKAGVEAMSKSLAQELATRGVRVNCVAPGFIATEMTEELNDKQKEAILSAVPMRRMGSAEDVALAVRFLLGDESKYITGQTISVNGGLYM